jgi:hypothetical protein
MSDEKQVKTSKRQPPPIGSSIPPQYKSFGSINGDVEEDGDDTKRPAVQTSKRLAVQTAAHPDVETSNTPAFQHSSIPEVRTVKPLEVQTSELPEVKRKQHTVYLLPETSKWVKLQAVLEEREISEIVEQALEEYRERQKGKQ